MEALRDYFFMYPLFVFILGIFGIPLSLIINGATALLINRCLRYRNNTLTGVIFQIFSVLIILTVVLNILAGPVSYESSPMVALAVIITFCFLIISLPQLLTNLFINGIYDKKRIYLSMALGVVSIIILGIIIMIIGNLVGAQTN